MHATMLVVQGKPRGKCIYFPPGEYLVGRGDECHLRLDSPWVSRQHCTLLVTKNKLIVRDLGSTNGTLVNGHRVTSDLEMHINDRLEIGPLELQYLEEQDFSGQNHADQTQSEDSDSGSSMQFEPISTP